MLTLLKSCTYADSMASAKSSGVQMSSAKYADKFAARSRLTAPRIGLYPLLFTFFQGRTGETSSHRTAHTATQCGLPQLRCEWSRHCLKIGRRQEGKFGNRLTSSDVARAGQRQLLVKSRCELPHTRMVPRE